MPRNVELNLGNMVHVNEWTKCNHV
ncbi:hypothetical protein ID866_11752 [Astraeus odoratus]|nr:hypothetical protein ID866_11752 [Astraeus odoratus]